MLLIDMPCIEKRIARLVQFFSQESDLSMSSVPFWKALSKTPKCHWLPSRVWSISGSRSPFVFFVDDGAWMIVASAMAPVAMRMPPLSGCRFTASSMAPPRSCSSSR